MEILVALVPMFAWGSIGLVSAKLGGDANQQTLGMTIGAFFFSLVVFFVTMPVIDGKVILIGLLSGLFWSVGQNGQFHGMKYLGVSVGLPLSTGMQLILNTVAGALFFAEWTQTRDYALGVSALILLVIGAYLTARQDGESPVEAGSKMLDFPKGFRALISSTIGYGAYTILITWAGLDPLAIILPQSVGMLIGASLFALRKTKVDRFVGKNTLSGLLWGIGNVCMLITVQQSRTSGGLLIVADGDDDFNARRDFYSRRKENQERTALCGDWLSAGDYRRCFAGVYESNINVYF